MADKRVFTLEIDGVKQSYDNVYKLWDLLQKIENTTKKVTVETDKASKSTVDSTNKTKEKTKALTDEEKAEKKLEQTLAKRQQLDTQMAKEQAKANQSLRERTQELQREVQLENVAIGSIDEKRVQLASLGKQYRALSEEERNAEHVGGAMLSQIQGLRSEYNQLERSLGNHAVNVGNYESATAGLAGSFEKLGSGIDKTSERAKGMLSIFQLGVGTVLAFSDGNSDLEKTLSGLGKIMTLVGAIQKINNGLIKNGTVAQIAYSLQSKARAGLDLLVTKGIISQTAAQTALNIATKAFPLLAVIGGISAIVTLMSNAADKANTYTSAIDGMNFATQEAADKHDDFIRRIGDIQIEIDVANGKITEYQASLLRLSNTKIGLKDEAFKKYNEIVKASLTELEDTYSGFGIGLQDLFTGAFSDTKTSQKALNKHNNIVKSAKEELEQDLANIDAETAKRVELENAKKEEKERKDEEEAAKRRKESAKSQSKQLQDLLKERNSIELELTRQAEDSKTELIINDFDKREEQIKFKYSRQREDLQRRLDEDKNLTDKSKNAINDLIKYSSDTELSELKKVSDERTKDNEIKINKQRETLDIIRQLNSDSADKEAEEIRKNASRELLYLTKNLENKSITQKEFDDSMLNLTIQSLESEISIRKKYGQDTTDLEIELSERRIKQADLEKKKVSEHFKELHETLQKYVDGIMSGVTAIFDATNSILQSQLDDANEKYEAISQKYDEVVEKREESDSRLEELEEQAKNARGGRALVLQEQINAEMASNQQLANQEKQLAKDKEKQEQEIAKKEKQMKRVELVQNIVQGIANTALGVTKALEWGFPLGPVFAAIVGAMGAVQVGVMTSQLAKLEDGGLLNGKRHSQGGMRIEGSNIEVEGGEYVINRESTSKNLGLVRYINSERRELKPADLDSFFASSSRSFESPFKRMFETGGQIPASVNTSGIDYSLMASAIKDSINEIKIEPKVSVTDINNAQNDIAKVDDFSGL